MASGVGLVVIPVLILPRPQFKYPYNLGIIGNFSSVLGQNPLLWCLPQKMEGTGLKYRVAKGLGKWSDWDDAPGQREDERDREAEWEDAGDVV